MRQVAAFRLQPYHGLLPRSDGGSQHPQEKWGLLMPAAAKGASAAANLKAARAAAAAETDAEGLPASILDLPPSFFKGKRVLVRGDLNLPVMEDPSSSNKSGYRVTDDTRMRALLPTLRYLLDAGARVLLLSHFGDPKLPLQEQQHKRFSLKMLVEPLQQMLHAPVVFAPNCIGEDTQKKSKELKEGEVLLLENVRLDAGEKGNSSSLGSSLADLCDVYVNDAFGAAHRKHASIDATPRAAINQGKPALAGVLMLKELQAIQRAVSTPSRPVAWIVGGAKVSSKAVLLKRLLSVSQPGDRILVGGCMALTFLKARGNAVGASMIEPEQLDTCREIESLASSAGVELLLPVDFLLGNEVSPTAKAMGVVTAKEGIPEGLMALDQGPQTNEIFTKAITNSKTIVWNGPMGVAENPAFVGGTAAVAAAAAAATAAGATSVVGGGDSLAAVKQLQKQQPDLQLSHLSTGGGATLKLLEGAPMPAVQALCTQQQLAQLLR